MKNKFLKTGIMISILMLLFIIVFFRYNPFLILGNQRLETVPLSGKLKSLEQKIQRETNSGVSTFFNEIPEYEMKDCNAKLELSLYINNDSIAASKEMTQHYIASVARQVNQILSEKKCIDSLMVNGSAYNAKENLDSLKTWRFRYSFPVK